MLQNVVSSLIYITNQYKHTTTIGTGTLIGITSMAMAVQDGTVKHCATIPHTNTLLQPCFPSVFVKM